jgi:hypothetical protein
VSLGEFDAAEDGCVEALEFDDDRPGTCAPVLAPGTATPLEDDGDKRPVCAVVLGRTGAVVSPGKSGSVALVGAGEGVVVGGWCARVTVRWLPLTPDETVTSPANTRIVNAAAATTAAPMTPAPTTKALCTSVRLSS